MKVYIASSEKYAGLIKEDIYIRDKYNSNGFSSKIATLSDIVNESKFGDLVILKSVWGYNLDYKTFLNQIKHLEGKGVKLMNDYQYIFWNIDKSKYLFEIKDCIVIPTYKLIFNKVKTQADISDYINSSTSVEWGNEIVIKPTISASGYLTFYYNLSDKSHNNIVLSSLYDNKEIEFIVQPYRKSISKGEISVIMLNGDVLYAVNRFPGIFISKKDTEYIKFVDIPKNIMMQVKNIQKFFIDKFNSYPNICRIDFVQFKDEYEILEIELIDPDLFFKNIPQEMLLKCLENLCDT